MKSLRIIFMGTPDFAVPTLQTLLESHHKVVGVFCQPDKASGRGQQITMPHTKKLALQYGVPVFQPKSFSDDSVKKTIESLQADLIIVIAYGRILPQWVLESPSYGAINLHGSILPAYRGAAPIQYSILNGDRQTGLTIMQMNEGLDTGDILKIIPISIGREETSSQLFERMAQLGGDNILSVLDELIQGKLIPVSQEEEKASYTSKITKEMAKINWQWSAEDIFSFVKGMSDWPGAFGYYKGKRIRIWRVVPKETGTSFTINKEVLPGQCAYVDKKRIFVQTGKGLLELLEVQLDNKKRMAVEDFLKGNAVEEGLNFYE